MTAVKHPAKFSPAILDVIRDLLATRLPEDALILDPFGGVGRVHELGWAAVSGDLELPWCRLHPGPAVVADATNLPYPDRCLDAVVTSPTYGNRFADKHRARDGSVRRSYTHDLRVSLGDEEYELHPNNTGGMKWGRDYWRMHHRAWDEVARVTKPGGWFVCNVSDFIRKGKVVRVVDWHRRCVIARGFELVDEVEVGTPRMRYGENGDARVAQEKVMMFRKGEG